MFDCPSCGKDTIGPWRKLCITAAVSVPCSACGSAISVPALDYAIGLVCFVPPVFLSSPWLYEAIGTGVYLVIHQWYVPLVVRTRAEP